jgi:hypothetical protein
MGGSLSLAKAESSIGPLPQPITAATHAAQPQRCSSMKTIIRPALTSLAIGLVAPASVAAPCTTCSVEINHSYRTTASRGDPNLFVVFADQRSSAADPSLNATTVLGTSTASSGIGVLKSAATFTGSLANMPLYRQDDQVLAAATFSDKLRFGGNGTDLLNVNVSLPFEYILGSGNPNVRAMSVTIQFTGYFLDFQRQRSQAVIDGVAGSVITDPTIYFAPQFKVDISANDGGSFLLPVSHLFRLHANTDYQMFVRLDTVATNSRSTRLADASHTLNIGPFTGDFTSVTSTNYGVLGSGGYPPAAAVPEPATWAMLIAGFGFVGIAARRRRQAGGLPA